MLQMLILIMQVSILLGLQIILNKIQSRAGHLHLAIQLNAYNFAVSSFEV